MEKQILPEFHLFPRLERAGKFIAGLLRPVSEAPLHTSDHYDPTHFTGASAMLDASLDNPVQDRLPFGWDSEGRYIDPSEY